MRRAIYLVFLTIVSVSFVFGQAAPVSQVSGIIQDESGLSIPNVIVTITNTDTSATRSVTTGFDGLYTFTALPVGPYRLEATAEGFNTYSQSGIVLQVASNPQINITMHVGAVTEVVQVEAAAVMVETQSAGVGQVIDNQRVIELPLNGRNVSQLIGLSGAAVQYSGGLTNSLNHPDAVAYSVGGGTGNSTNYVLDGGSHVDPRTNVGMPLPFPDAMQEFKVESSSLPANYGSQPGGAVNVVTKSGTNEFHGNAFWFVRNGRLNARHFFADSRDSLKRNQFGGTFGGPIKENKLFFFGAVQRTTTRTAPSTTTAWVATEDVLKGDFRAMLGSKKTLDPEYADGNVLKPGLINEVALNFFKQVPTSNDPSGKIQYAVPEKWDGFQGVLKFDWNRSAGANSFIRYYMNDNDLLPYLDSSNILTNLRGLLNRVQSVIIGDTWVINARVVNSLRLKYDRSAVNRQNAEGTPTFKDLGADLYTPIDYYMGSVSTTGYWSTNQFPGYVYTNTYGLSDDVGWTMDRHQLSIGFTYNLTLMNALGAFQMNPRMNFTGTFTNDGLADFLIGKPSYLLQGGGQVGREIQHSPALYFQDNWKVADRIQINMGIRWDPFIPQRSKYEYAAKFSMNDYLAGVGSQQFDYSPKGVSFVGDPAFEGRKTNTPPHYAQFAPRLGIVIDPRGTGRETIRAGYGLFYNGSSYLWHTMHVPLNPPWGQTIELNASNIGSLSDPWENYPGGNPFPPPTEFPRDFEFPDNGKYVFESDQGIPTYMQQWNLSLQKQVGANWLFSATYMGNKTSHLWLGRALNPAVYIPGDQCTINGVTYKPCSSTSNTSARRVLTLADPENGALLGNVYQVDDGGNGSYHALLMSMNKRFSSNFSVLANYTWSHCLNEGEPDQDIVNYYQDPNNRGAEMGNCSTDRRHIFNSSIVARSPGLGNGALRMITNNWGWSGIITAQSGSSLSISTGRGRDYSLTGLTSDRANLVGNPTISNPTIDMWFNADAFTVPSTGQFGNLGRSFGLYGPGRWNVDMALWRDFPVKEAVTFDFRFEAFNVFNHANFGNPNTDITSTRVGTITSASDPRILQLAAKITF